MAKKEASKRSYRKSAQSKYSRYLDRRNKTVETEAVIEGFLIVYEGEKTEPNYFRSFRVPKNVIDVRGFGKNPTKLIEKAIEIRDNEGEYDQVWYVFDRDSWPEKNFNQAIEDAENNDIRVAYSNQAFEIWYLLHFAYRDTAMSRKEYEKYLTKRLNKKYEKNSKTIYSNPFRGCNILS